MARRDVGHRRAATLVGNVADVGARAQLEQLGREMLRPKADDTVSGESSVQWRALQMPVGRLLIGVAGGEDAGLVEGADTIWKPTGMPSRVMPPGSVSVG